MNIGDLKKLIADMDDEIIIVHPGNDHSMRIIDCSVGTVLQESRYKYTEDFGEVDTPEAMYGKRIPALICGE
jgi:hypothetical protein